MVDSDLLNLKIVGWGFAGANMVEFVRIQRNPLNYSCACVSMVEKVEVENMVQKYM